VGRFDPLSPEGGARKSVVGISISIHTENEFADGQMAEYAKRSAAILADVQSIKSRVQSPDLIVPDVPRGELLSKCPSADDLGLIRRFEKGGSGSSGLEFKRPAADAASGGLRWLYA